MTKNQRQVAGLVGGMNFSAEKTAARPYRQQVARIARGVRKIVEGRGHQAGQLPFAVQETDVEIHVKPHLPDAILARGGAPRINLRHNWQKFYQISMARRRLASSRFRRAACNWSRNSWATRLARTAPATPSR